MGRTVKVKIILEECVGAYGLYAHINPDNFGTGVCEGCSFWNYCNTIRDIKDELGSCKKY